MTRSQKIGRWICIFLAGIIIYFLGAEHIANGIGQITEILYSFFKDKIFIPIAKFVWWIVKGEWVYDEDLISMIIYGGLYILGVSFSIVLMFFLGIAFIVLFIIKAIGGSIRPFMDANLPSYFLSVFVFAYISGRFFHSIIFPWICQQGETILALTLGRFFYQLHKERRHRKLKEIEEGYIKKKDKIEDLRNALIKLTEEISPELLGFVPTETFEYKGWPEEMFKRLRIRQQEKTAKAVSAHLDALREVWEKWGSIYQAIAKYELSVYRLLNLSKEIAIEEAIKNKKKRAEFERIDLEERMERLKIEKQIAQLEGEIKKIKSLPSGDDDRYIQETKKLINKLKATGASVRMLSEEREKQLSDPELRKNEEVYQKVENLWNKAIMDLLERK